MKIQLLLETAFTLALLIKSHPSSAVQITTDDFQTLLLNDDLYVDKSLLIEEFLEDMKNNSLPRPTISSKIEVTPMPIGFIPIVLRPEGWGKSTNLAMLKKFFEIEADDRGNRLSKEEQTNGKLFLGGDFALGSSNVVKKLKPLKIANCPDALEHLGAYPVVVVQMKDTTGNTVEELGNNMKLCIGRAFKTHPYLLDSPNVTDKETLSRYFKGTINRTELIRSLYFLSEKLYEHYGRKSLIFVDDFDMPAINGQLAISTRGQEFNQFLLLIKLVYDKCYTRNPYLSSGILSGSVMAVRSPVVPVQNDYPAWNLLERKPPFVKHYGFTQPEVDELLSKVSIKVDPVQLHTWYGNYHIFGPETFYSPRSVMRCLANNATFQYYESESNLTALIDEILGQEDLLQTLHREIRQPKLVIYFYYFCDLTPLFQQYILVMPRRVLYWGGYLKADSRSTNGLVVIPNEEKKYFFEIRIMRWVARKFCLHPYQFHSFVEQILRGEIYQFRDALRVHLNTAAKFYPLKEEKTNIFYSSLLTAIKAALSKTHSTNSSGLLGFDAEEHLILIPRPGRSDAAVVITYVAVVEEKSLISKAVSGLWRVYMRRYGKQMKTYSHVRKVIQISMAFHKQKLELQCSIEKQ